MALLYTGIGILGKVAKLYYADSERLATSSAGIDVTGTVNSTGEMRITNPSATSQLYLYGASGQKANIILNEYGVRAWHLGAGTYTSGKFSISDGTTERLVIDASGNVGIGTSSPSVPLTVNNDTDHSDVAIFHAGGGTPNRGYEDKYVF